MELDHDEFRRDSGERKSEEYDNTENMGLGDTVWAFDEVEDILQILAPKVISIFSVSGHGHPWMTTDHGLFIQSVCRISVEEGFGRIPVPVVNTGNDEFILKRVFIHRRLLHPLLRKIDVRLRAASGMLKGVAGKQLPRYIANMFGH